MGKNGRESRLLSLKILLACLPGFLFPAMGWATHIIGAELWYECQNTPDHRYKVTLRVLNDCINGEAPLDNPIYLYVFPDNDPLNFSVYTLPVPSDTPSVLVSDWQICVGTGPQPCVKEAIYERIIKFPPRPGGYHLAWARCCRNGLITNITNPLDEGVTFLATIPGEESANCNSSPVFFNDAPIFLCRGREFVMNHGAVDPDGDSLVYALTRPYSGINFQGLGASTGSPGPVVTPVFPANHMGPPPYAFVNYVSPIFNAQNPFGPNSATIDPQTGWLTFNPPSLGVFVVAVSVFEYRNGILLSENKRDFQVHVRECTPEFTPPQITHDLSGLNTSGDTIIIDASMPFCYDVLVTDSIVSGLLNAEAVSPVFSVNPFPPNPTVTFSGTNPLIATICWEPACEYADQVVPLILTGWDSGDCPLSGHVFDTVWVHILPPPDVNPVASHDLSLSPSFNGDTIVVEVDSNACFTWTVTDTFQTGSMEYEYLVQSITGGGNIIPTVSVLVNQPDSLVLSACFNVSCSEMGELFRLVLIANNEAGCVDDRDFDTVYVLVPPLPNPPPQVMHDLSGNIFSNDTLYTEVHDTFCYTFVVQDTFPGIQLSYLFQLTALDGQPAGGPLPVVTLLNSNDSLLGEICWAPNCDNVSRIFRLVVAGTQENRCNQFAQSLDTVYVVVNPENNPPPVLSHQFIPGTPFSGDTILITPDSAACFEFSLRDTVYRSYLSLSAWSELVSTGDSSGHNLQVNFTTVTDTLLEGTICFTPGCSYTGELLRVIVTGVDTFDCTPDNQVFDTIYIRVIEPYNNPPAVAHDLTGLTVENGIVVVTPNGQPYCYTVIVTDPDVDYAALVAEGANDIFRNNWGYGNPAEISVSGTNPLNVTVCWNPSCYDSGKEFDLEVCARDTSRCGLTPEVCDVVKFRVGDCTLDVGNVFTPNGDGINDEFLPFNQQGVQFYEMLIFDRWGVKVTEVWNQAWNGTYSPTGKPVPEGVYYYIVRRQFWSAKGVPLDDTLVGWVTLMR